MKVEDRIYINAPPEVVWTVTVDIERWPEWTPTVKSVKRVDAGPFGPGSVARIKQPAQPESEWTVTVFERGRRFAWTTKRFGLRMTGSHEVSAAGAGTMNVLGVEAGGALAVLLWPLLRTAMKKALQAENQGLKARCEELTR